MLPGMPIAFLLNKAQNQHLWPPKNEKPVHLKRLPPPLPWISLAAPKIVPYHPNRELTEVNARQSVFYPEIPGRHYITVRGFTLEQAATPWAPPTTEQIGLLGTNWSKGWIIENNTIRGANALGIDLGRES